MGDDDGRAVGHQPLDGALHQLFALGIERAGRLVEEENRGVAQDRAGDGDALALTAGETHPFLAEIAVEAFGQLVEEPGRGRRLGGGAHLIVVRLRAAIADVLPAIGGEDHRVLGHQAHAGADLGGIGVAKIDAVQRDTARPGVIEAQQHLHDGGLAGARRADQGDLLAGLKRQRKVDQRRGIGPRRIVEGDVIEAHLAARRAGKGCGPRRRRDVGLGGEQIDQPLGRAGGALQFADDLGDGAGGAGHHHGIEDEGRKFAGGNTPLHDVVAADPQDGADGAEDEDDDQGRQDRAHTYAADGDGEGRLDAPVEAGAVDGLVAEGLDGAHRVQAFLDMGADVRHPVLAGARKAAHPAPDQNDRRHHQRHHQENERAQLGAGDRQHHHAADQQKQVSERDRRGGPDEDLQQRGVGGDAREHLAGAGELEETGAEADDVAEDGLPDVADHPLAEPGYQIEPRIAGPGQHHDDAEKGEQGVVQKRGIAAGEALIDQPPQAQAHHQHRAGGDGKRHQRPRHRRPVGPDEAVEMDELIEISGALGRLRRARIL